MSGAVVFVPWWLYVLGIITLIGIVYLAFWIILAIFVLLFLWHGCKWLWYRGKEWWLLRKENRRVGKHRANRG